MAIAKKILLFLLLNLCMVVQAQVQKYDLSNIKTIEEAKSYYNSCMSIPFGDSVSRDDVVAMLHRLYALSQRICMRSIDDIEDIDRYSCEIQASNTNEELELNFLRSKVSGSFLCVQQFLDVFQKTVDINDWQNFTNYYSALYKRTNYTFLQNLVWYEAELNGINFIELHNFDDNIAYEIKVCHEVNKKTLVREYTLMPRKVKVIASDVDGTGIYFTPSSVEITNKYYIGER